MQTESGYTKPKIRRWKNENWQGGISALFLYDRKLRPIMFLSNDAIKNLQNKFLKNFEKSVDKTDNLSYNNLVVHDNTATKSNTKYSSIAQSVEHAAVNRAVVGSSPTRGARSMETRNFGPMVKRLRHRPFTAVTRVQISLGSFGNAKECGPLAQLVRATGS